MGTIEVGDADGVDGVCTKRRTLRHSADVFFSYEWSHTMEVTTIGLDLGKDVFQSSSKVRSSGRINAKALFVVVSFTTVSSSYRTLPVPRINLP